MAKSPSRIKSKLFKAKKLKRVYISFKQKYKPEWRGKYLAYKKNTSLPVTMVLVTKLIGMDPNRSRRP